MAMTGEDQLARFVWNLYETTVYLEKVSLRKSLILLFKSTVVFSLSLINVNFLTIVIACPATEEQNLLSLRNLESTNV